jgi:hypothetical protein
MTKKTQLKYITLTFIARAYSSQFHLKWWAVPNSLQNGFLLGGCCAHCCKSPERFRIRMLGGCCATPGFLTTFILHYWYTVLYSLVESFSVYCCIISVLVCSATWVRLYVGIYWKLWSNNPLLADWHMASYYGNPELCQSPNSGCEMLNARAISGSNSHSSIEKDKIHMTLWSKSSHIVKDERLRCVCVVDAYLYLLCLWRLT